MNRTIFGLAALLLLTTACLSARQEKINFDLAQLNDEGLTGPPDGLVSISYEFCIPRSEEKAAEIRRIDPSVELFEGAGGRIGCSAGQYLCIGNTHQPGFRQVLRRLAALDYVERIDRTFFE